MATRWLKLTVAYDGTDYAGWQIQPDKPTVQAAIEAAWHEITRETVRVTAAGRTDAGVHALGQVVAVATENQLPVGDLQRGLNAMLPPDVAVVELEEAAKGFHATYDALGKTYRYQIHTGRVPTIFDRRYVWHYPHSLDAEAMHASAQALIGKHDFSSFESAGSERPDSVRTITDISVRRGDGVLADRSHHRSLRRRLLVQYGPGDRWHPRRSRTGHSRRRLARRSPCRPRSHLRRPNRAAPRTLPRSRRVLSKN